MSAHSMFLMYVFRAIGLSLHNYRTIIKVTVQMSDLRSDSTYATSQLCQYCYITSLSGRVVNFFEEKNSYRLERITSAMRRDNEKKNY